MRTRSTNASDVPAGFSIPTALADAIELCKRRRVQLTTARRALLEILWEQPCRPQGAYPLMRRLEAVSGRPVTATSVYRTLEFLLDQGLVIRIESLNAYLPYPNPETSLVNAYSLCDVCGNATGVNDAAIEWLLDERAKSCGFGIRRKVVELQGICQRCRHRRGTGKQGSRGIRV